MLFYFSATGNTRQVALWIAERLGERAVDIETISGAYSYRLDKDERLGFAFPVYFGTVPSIVADVFMSRWSRGITGISSLPPGRLRPMPLGR